jgi:hypothetical protein
VSFVVSVFHHKGRENSLNALAFGDPIFLLFLLLQLGNDLFPMPFRLHIFKDVSDLAGRVDDERGSGNALHFSAIQVLFFNHPKLLGDFFVPIGKEPIRQVVLCLEFLVRTGLIGRDTQDRGPYLLQFAERFAKLASLDGSAGGVGLREKEDDDTLASELA